MLITKSGAIKVNGLPSTDSDLLENEVIFEGDRLEPGFENVPGQWETIWLFNGSTDNIFNHVTIKNSTAGIVSEGNQEDASKLIITNTQIYNASNFGILGRATSITAENLVINNCGQAAFAGTYGGRYQITHATLVNYWSNSFRQFPSVIMTNYYIDEDNTIYTNPLESANFTNCIIYGNDNPELILDKNNDADFNFKFTNSLIRFDDPFDNFSEPQYDFDDSDLYENCIFNEAPEFLNTQQNLFNIPNGSPADGNAITFGLLTADITNTTRGILPDIGAYESVEFQED